MQKLSVSEQIPKEATESEYCARAIESFKTFQQTKNDNNLYEIFINDLKTFVVNEINTKLIENYSILMLNDAMKIFPSKIFFNEKNSISLLEILTRIVSIEFMKFDVEDFSEFFFSMISNIDFFKILSNFTKTFEKIFENETFFNEFVSQQRVSQFFELSFIQFKSVDLCTLFRHLICEVSPPNERSNINLSIFISFLLTTIRKEIQVEFSIVLSKLIASSKRNRLFLNNTQSFDLFSNYIQSAESSIVVECFNDLVFTSPIDIEIFSNFILFYQKYKQHQNPLFQWIFNDVVQNHTELIYDINNVIPFTNWITLSTKVNDVINAILALSKIDINLTSPFISPLFSLLNKGDSNFEDYKTTIQIIENQILLHQISLNSLSSSLFLETFVINITIDLLGQLFEKVYTFSQLVYDIYTLPQSENLRGLIVNKLIQMAGKFPSNAHIISIFLVVSNSKKNISDLMKTIVDNKNGDLCIALGDSFIKSESVVNYFINGNGIEWLDQIYKMKIINIQNLVYLINSLTKNYFIKEVDNYINSLPKNHPILSLNQDDLFTLCYGFEGSHHYYPLKILALFPLLDAFQRVDPYNAYMIGKHAIDKFEHMEKMLLFSDVVNRYVNDKTFNKLIKMDASKFDSFCNPHYDHFPLFQVYDFLNENSFDVKFKAISFWFKFGPTIQKELKIPFFHCDKLQLFLKDSKLIANYEGVEYDAPVNPLKWNNVIVVVSAQKVSHYVEVYVNLNKAVFISSRLFIEMPNFEFSTYSAFMFIGPAIRIYQNEMIENDIDKIYKNGPSFLGHLNESLIITPFTKKYLEFGRNVFAVKYRGFPVHFLSRKKLNILFDRMTNQKCQENDFFLFVSFCFKIFLMLRNSLHDFFRSILTVYSKVPKFISPKLLSDTFEFFSKYQQKKEIINTIIGHKQFWSNVPKDIIINSLLSKFKNFDFYSEKEKLEIFLSTQSFSNFNNPKLFDNLFQCSKKCQLIIHELFTSSHLISEKQDKLTQTYFNQNDLSKNNEESIEIVDPNNISVQCNVTMNYSLKSFNLNPDSIEIFQTINPIPFQMAFANILKKQIKTIKNISYVPIDGVYSLFLTSDTELKSILFSVLLNCEKINPNSVQFDYEFISNVPQLYNNNEVWTETFELISEDSKEITKPILLPVLFALFWGATVASLHSIVSTGKTILNDNEVIIRIINFLLNERNMKIISTDKNVLKFINSWFPFLFAENPPQNNDFITNFNEGYETQNYKLNGDLISLPSPFCFMSMIWNNVIKESGLPIQSKKEYYKELQSFLVCSHIFDFYFKFMFSLSETHFIEFLGSFIIIPFFSSNKELTKCFVCDFIHSLLNIVAESYTLTMKIELISPFIHSMCYYQLIPNNYLTTILSDLFLITSVIYIAYKSSFNKFAHDLNLLVLHLLFSFLNVCKNNSDQNNIKNMINILYQLLFQNIHFLLKIVIDSQKVIDLYLLFFKQSYQFCTKKEIFNKIVSQFNKELKIENELSVNDEKIDLDLTEWENFVKSNILQVINRSETNHFSFSYIRSCSKSYTISFLSSLDKQIQVSEKLDDLFIQSKLFCDSKIDWNKTIHGIYQSYNDLFYTNKILESNEIERKKILAPFMFPLRIPRLYIVLPDMINNEFNIIKFIEEMNLYKFSLDSLDDLIQQIKGNNEFDEKPDIIQCEIKRLSETIESILIVLNNEILILPFCKINYSNPKSMNDINQPLKSTEVCQFIKEVICGMWGNSILYKNRIVIRIKQEYILLVEQIDKKSMTVWSTSCGHFIIQKFASDVIKFVARFKNRKNFPFSSSLRIPTIEKFIISWKNSQLSNSQLLLGINLFNHRTFCDVDNFPLLPSNLTIFGSSNPMSETILKNLTQAKSIKVDDQIKFSNTIEESQESVSQYIIDKFMLNINIKDRKMACPLFDINKQFLAQKLNTEEIKEGEIFDFNYNTDSNKLIFNLPKLSSRISDENEMIFLLIDKERLSLLMYDYKNKRIINEERSSLLANAKNLYVSENRFFFSIDFNTDISCIYQIIYSNWSPISFKFIRDISFEMKQSTCISGVDWLAITNVNDRIVMWHFFPNTIHRIIQFDSKIYFVKVDENSGTVWVVSKATNEVNDTEKLNEFECDINFTILSVNGEIFTKKSFHFESNKKIKISSFAIVPQPISVNDREAVCGFSDGSIYFISISSLNSNSDSSNDIKIMKLKSLHELPIKCFIFHPCTTFFVSIDSGHVAFVWSQIHERYDDHSNRHFLDISAFESCPSCGCPDVSIYCKCCGRAFCEKCIESNKKCKECSNE